MLIKTVLNRLECFKSFVFGQVTLQMANGSETLVIELKYREEMIVIEGRIPV